MAEINWVFVVNFDEYFLFVIYFLIKSHCYLVCVNLLYVAGFPPMTATDVKPIFPSSSFKDFNICKFCLILFTGAHIVLIAKVVFSFLELSL